MTTQYAIVTKVDFDAYVTAEIATLEKAVEPARFALLKRNMAEVDRQMATGALTFAVELPVVEKVDPLQAALARIAELEKKFDGRLTTGVGDVKPPTPAAKPDPEPAVTAPAADTTAPAAVAATDVAPTTDAAVTDTEKGKPFPGAAPPFGADGKPAEMTPEEQATADAKAKALAAVNKKGADSSDATDTLPGWDDMAKAMRPSDADAYRMAKGVIL